MNHNIYLKLHWADQSDLGYRWKNLFLLQNLSIEDANFGQKWWGQKWNKGQCLSWPVNYGRHRSQWVKNDFGHSHLPKFTISQSEAVSTVLISCDIKSLTWYGTISCMHGHLLQILRPLHGYSKYLIHL